MAKGKKKTKAEQQADLAEKMKSKLYNPEGDNVVEFNPHAGLEDVIDRPHVEVPPQDTHSDSAGKPDGIENAEANEVEEQEPDNVEEGEVVTLEDVGDEEPRERHSIVKDKFKDKYIANAEAQGLKHKAAKRSNWDWLSQQLAAFCLSDKGKIDIGSFTDVLTANGIDHSKWTNKNKGWEGRFRMTGRVALQKVVANAGVLKWPNGEPTEVPADFIEKYRTKA